MVVTDACANLDSNSELTAERAKTSMNVNVVHHVVKATNAPIPSVVTSAYAVSDIAYRTIVKHASMWMSARVSHVIMVIASTLQGHSNASVGWVINSNPMLWLV
jgi:hypothetical protein